MSREHSGEGSDVVGQPPADEAPPTPGTDPPEDAGDDQGDGREDAATEPEWQRRRRLEKAFGSGEHHGGGKGDSWYRDEVPPHHG